MADMMRFATGRHRVNGAAAIHAEMLFLQSLLFGRQLAQPLAIVGNVSANHFPLNAG